MADESRDALHAVDGRACWTGDDLARREDEWIHRFTEVELAELDSCIQAFRARDADIVQIRQCDFALATLGPRLARIREEVVHGRGFHVLRGLPVGRYSMTEAAIAFLGIGTHFGTTVSQNAKGHALGHVRDLGFDYFAPTSRGYQTSARLPYHTDGSDLAALLCLKTAREGGLSSIVSSVTAYKEMARRRPELAQLLTQPVYRDRRDEIPQGARPWYRMPVFNLYKGRVLTSYVRSTVRKAQRFEEVPRITPALDEAMDLLDELAADPALHLDMKLEPGDVQFVNNHTLLHSRTAYIDHQAPAAKRHLLRLWLACADGPPLPPPYEEFQGLNADGRPNGYLLKDVALNAPLDPHDGGPGDSSRRVRGAPH